MKFGLTYYPTLVLSNEYLSKFLKIISLSCMQNCPNFNSRPPASTKTYVFNDSLFLWADNNRNLHTTHP